MSFGIHPVCSTVDTEARGKGIAVELLDGAVEYAFAHVRDANKRAIVRVE